MFYSNRAKINMTSTMLAQWLFLLQNLEKKQNRLQWSKRFEKLPGFKYVRKWQMDGIKRINHDISVKKQEILKLQREGKINEIITSTNTISVIKKGTGWLKEPKDYRDYDAPEKLSKIKSVSFLAKYTNTKYIIDQSKFTPIKDQGSLGACTAFAGCSQLEYYVKRKTGQDINLSELFLYLETRRNLGWEKEDTGAYIRTTMKTMASVGTCLEKEWTYNENDFTIDPPAYIYSRADDYKADSYFKIDTKQYDKKQVLSRIKSALQRNLPLTFGFSCYESALSQSSINGKIPYPTLNDTHSGGHAVLMVGYDDNIVIKNNQDNSATTGAFVFRNSWGKNWGDQGRGYIPYTYLLDGKISDIWCLIRMDYLNESRFK